MRIYFGVTLRIKSNFHRLALVDRLQSLFSLIKNNSLLLQRLISFYSPELQRKRETWSWCQKYPRAALLHVQTRTSHYYYSFVASVVEHRRQQSTVDSPSTSIIAITYNNAITCTSNRCISNSLYNYPVVFSLPPSTFSFSSNAFWSPSHQCLYILMYDLREVSTTRE